MIRAIRCELTRFKNPYLLLGSIGLMPALGVLATIIVFVTAGSGSLEGAPGLKGATTAMLEASDGMFAGVRNAASVLGVVVLVVWAMSVTSDYSTGLIRLLVQAEPGRLRLLAGKVVSLALLTCAATAVTTLVVAPASPSVAQATGVSTAAWSQGLVGTVVAGYLQLTLSALLWGVVGLFVGLATRSSGVAVGLGIGYLVVFEGLVGLVLEGGSKWLPGASFAAVASGGTAEMSLVTALAVAFGYAAAAVCASAVLFARRDITA